MHSSLINHFCLKYLFYMKLTLRFYFFIILLMPFLLIETSCSISIFNYIKSQKVVSDSFGIAETSYEILSDNPCENKLLLSVNIESQNLVTQIDNSLEGFSLLQPQHMIDSNKYVYLSYNVDLPVYKDGSIFRLPYFIKEDFVFDKIYFNYLLFIPIENKYYCQAIDFVIGQNVLAHINYFIDNNNHKFWLSNSDSLIFSHIGDSIKNKMDLKPKITLDSIQKSFPVFIDFGLDASLMVSQKIKTQLEKKGFVFTPQKIVANSFITQDTLVVYTSILPSFEFAGKKFENIPLVFNETINQNRLGWGLLKNYNIVYLFEKEQWLFYPL